MQGKAKRAEQSKIRLAFPLGFEEGPVQQSSNTTENSNWKRTKREKGKKRVNDEEIQVEEEEEKAREMEIL